MVSALLKPPPDFPNLKSPLVGDFEAGEIAALSQAVDCEAVEAEVVRNFWNS